MSNLHRITTIPRITFKLPAAVRIAHVPLSLIPHPFMKPWISLLRLCVKAIKMLTTLVSLFYSHRGLIFCMYDVHFISLELQLIETIWIHTIPKVHILSKNNSFSGVFTSQKSGKNMRKSLIRVTYFLQTRVGWILDISKALIFWTKIGLLT